VGDRRAAHAATKERAAPSGAGACGHTLNSQLDRLRHLQLRGAPPMRDGVMPEFPLR